jgi:hypothetical protein
MVLCNLLFYFFFIFLWVFHRTTEYEKKSVVIMEAMIGVDGAYPLLALGGPGSIPGLRLMFLKYTRTWRNGSVWVS